MRPFWYLVFLVGLVASEDPKSNDVPGCGDLKSGSKEMNPTTPTTRTETTSTMTTEETTSSTTTTEVATSPSTTTTSTTTPSTTPKKGAREADRRKYVPCRLHILVSTLSVPLQCSQWDALLDGTGKRTSRTSIH
ncbi:uncharacterized protein [Dermacentor andersoni]|uniref:uncharacterized protein isoform X3 n=1 Tax=Dermacentor andersoni TaxID=34620 RepID=UPI002416C4CE|nr:integumentary mucin C.1-like isoform X3 [Dermacentor andersoni]